MRIETHLVHFEKGRAGRSHPWGGSLPGGVYLWVHSEEGVGAPAAQGRSLEGLAVVKMIVIIQVSNLQNKKQVTIL